MPQVLDCGNLDISKITDEAVTIDRSAWVSADVDEKVYLFSKDYNDADEPVFAFAVIKFSSPCLATVCENNTKKSLLMALSTQEAILREQEAFRNSALDQTFDLNQKINNQLAGFGMPVLDQDHISPEWGIQRATPLVNNEVIANQRKAIEGLDSENINNFGFQAAAVRPLGAVIPVRHNFDTYGPWASNNLWTSRGGIDVKVEPSLAPWTFGSVFQLNMAGEDIVEFSNRGLTKAETGSVTLVGIPSSVHNVPQLGKKLSTFGPNLTNVNFSIGSKGATTTYEFKTYTPKFGKLSRLFYDRYKEINKGRNQQLKILKTFQANQNKLYRKIAARNNREKLDTIKSTALKNSMQRVIIGQMTPWYNLNGEFSMKSVVGISTLDEASLAATANYENKAFLSLDGIFSPVSNGFGPPYLPKVAGVENSSANNIYYPDPPSNNNSNELKINALTYDPLNKGSHPYGMTEGHNIDVLGGKPLNDNGLLHSMYDYRDPNKYSESYNFIALRGPLMLHSWGYDLDGKPVPNLGGQSSSFPNNWLQKPNTWPVAPIDLRFDQQRGVWTTPQPYRIVAATLSQDLQPYGSASASVIGGGYWITVVDRIGKKIKAGSKCYVYYDTKDKTYIILEYEEPDDDDELEEITVVTDIRWESRSNPETGNAKFSLVKTTKKIKAIVIGGNQDEDEIIIETTECPSNDPDEDLLGACLDDAGQCIETTQSNCDGTFQAGVVCSDSDSDTDVTPQPGDGGGPGPGLAG